MKTKISPNKLSKLANNNQFPFFTYFANQILRSYERNNGADLKWKKGITVLERTSIKNLIPIQNQINVKCLYAAISQDYPTKEDRELVEAVAKYLAMKSDYAKLCCATDAATEKGGDAYACANLITE